MSEVEVTLFQPQGKSLKVEYPELADVEEFDSLTSSELKFVWLYSNRTSPHYEDKNFVRKINKCVKDSFGRLDSETLKRYQSGSFPHKIKVAAKKMEQYNPTLRLQAKLGVEKIFNNLQKLIDVSEEELKVMELSSKKDYVALAIKVSESLPNIVSQLESGFGIDSGVAKKKSSDKGPSIMDRLHMEDELEM